MRTPLHALALTACLGLLTMAPFAAPAQEDSPVGESAKLVRVLNSDASVYDKAMACRRLAVIGQATAVPALADLLGNTKLATYARSALEAIPDAAADEALRAAVGRLEGDLLVGVLESIGKRRDPRAIEVLAPLLRTGSRPVASAAARTLGHIGSTEAAGVLRHELEESAADFQPAVATACLICAETLVKHGGRDTALPLYEAVRQTRVPEHVVAAATYRLIATRGREALPLLAELLSSEEEAQFRLALQAARDVGAEAAGTLSGRFDQLPPPRQALALAALSDLHSSDAMPTLLKAVAAEDPGVRLAAVEALGSAADAKAVPALLTALATTDTELKTAAIASLHSLTGRGVDDAIVAGMKSAEGGPRCELIGVLAQRRYVAATSALLAEAASPDEEVAGAAFRALGDLAEPQHLPAMVKLLLSTKSADVASQAERAIALVALRLANPDQRADPVLTALPSEQRPPQRASLIRVLGKLDGQAAFAAVAGALGDANAQVREAAVTAMADWPDARAEGPLLRLVAEAGDPIPRALALRGYVRLLRQAPASQAQQTARKFTEVLRLVSTPEAKKLVLGGLGDVAHVEALELAEEHLDDPTVRSEAAFATVKIARAIVVTDAASARRAAEEVLAVAKADPAAAEARKLIRWIETLDNSLIAWRVAGPYSKDGLSYSELFDVAFEPEKPASEAVDWRPLPAGTDPKRPWVLDLLSAIGGAQRVAYALTWVHAEEAQPARLELGSDDGIKAWLNGRLVHANNTARAAEAYTDRVDLELAAGWNALLLKITQNDSPWEFCARVCTRQGKPLDNLRVDPNHEGNWWGAAKPAASTQVVALFDGKTFAGWEGNLEWFRLEDSAIVAGDLKREIPRNEFLCTTREYANFELRLKAKLVDNKGNAGIQIRSQRIPNHHEMIGYQADIAQGYWGSLYDESRRRKFLAQPDPKALTEVLKPTDWNDYVIRCEGKRIQLWLNGLQTVDYTEPDEKIPQQGFIGLQIHGGPASEVWYRDLQIEELP